MGTHVLGNGGMRGRRSTAAGERPPAPARAGRALLALLGLLALAAAACGGGASSSGAPSSSQPTAITASYSELVPDELGTWVAADAGYFSRNHLDVNLQYIASTQGVAALLSGQVQIAQLGGSEVLGAAAGGADVKIVANMVPVFPFVFEVPGSIQSIDQLKGKKVGVSQFGGSSDIATRDGLQKNGLDPTRDVTLVQTGSAANRVAALKSGAIQGAMSQPPESTKLEQVGFHPLFDLAKQRLPAANTVVATTGAYLASHHSVVQAYVDSLVEALAAIHKDPSIGDRALAKYEKVSDPNLQRSATTYYAQEILPVYPDSTPAQYQTSISALKGTNPKLASVDLSKVLDDSFVSSARQRKVGG